MTDILHEGQTDVKLKLRVDYDSGVQVTENFLENCTELKILYKWTKSEADDVSGDWTATGYEMSGTTPYIYYTFSGDDAVPDDAAGYLVLRAKLTDVNSRVSMGRLVSIPVLSDSL